MTLTPPRWEGQPFETKVGDTTPFEDFLELETVAGSGIFAPLDLTGATVRFLASQADGTPLFSGAAVVVAPSTAGHVKFAPSAGQMATIPPATDHRAEWQITFSDGTVTTVPQGNAYRRLIVAEDLG